MCTYIYIYICRHDKYVVLFPSTCPGLEQNMSSINRAKRKNVHLREQLASKTCCVFPRIVSQKRHHWVSRTQVCQRPFQDGRGTSHDRLFEWHGRINVISPPLNETKCQKYILTKALEFCRYPNKMSSLDDSAPSQTEQLLCSLLHLKEWTPRNRWVLHSQNTRSIP